MNMSTRKGLLVAAAILAGSVGLAAFLVSLAPEPERREPPPQIPFAQTGQVTAGDGAIPVHGGRHRAAQRGSRHHSASRRQGRLD